MSTSTRRYFYLDFLKVIASFSVILIHVAATKFYVLDVSSLDWKILNVFNSLTRFSVPAFVMITGVFVLDPNRMIETKTFFKKYIFKTILIYIVVSSLYTILSFVMFGFDYTPFELIKQFVYRVIDGPPHLTYLYTLVGLYLASPFLRKLFTKDNRMLLLFILFSFTMNLLVHLKNITTIDTIELLINRTGFNLTTGFVFYLSLGYYLHNHKISKTWTYLIYLVGILGLMSTYVLSDFASNASGNAVEIHYGYLNTNIMLVSTAVFLFIKNVLHEKNISSSIDKLFTTLSKNNLFVYLFHPFVIILLDQLDVFSLNIPILPYFIVLSVVVYGMSLIPILIYNRLKSSK